MNLVTIFILYSIIHTVVGVQLYHANNFRGLSRSYPFMLFISSLAAMASSVILVVLYAIQVSVIIGVLMLPAGFLVGKLWLTLLNVSDPRSGKLAIMSILGFIIWPAAAFTVYLMI